MSRVENSVLHAERENHRLGWRRTWLEIIASLVAIGGVATSTWLGFVSKDLNSDVARLNAQIDTLNGDVATAQAQLDVRQEAIEELREENAELRAALPRSIAPEDVPDARNVGVVNLAEGGDAIDLNSTLDTFDAGTNYGTSDSLSYRDGKLTTSWHGLDILPLNNEQKASYETCAVATGYAPTSSIEPHRLAEGEVCIRLQSANYARIVVQEHTAERVTLEITTWEPPL